MSSPLAAERTHTFLSHCKPVGYFDHGDWQCIANYSTDYFRCMEVGYDRLTTRLKRAEVLARTIASIMSYHFTEHRVSWSRRN